MELRVVGAVDLAHPAHTEAVGDAIVGDCLSDHRLAMLYGT
jgi:hypothetical protein